MFHHLTGFHQGKRRSKASPFVRESHPIVAECPGSGRSPAYVHYSPPEILAPPEQNVPKQPFPTPNR